MWCVLCTGKTLFKSSLEIWSFSSPGCMCAEESVLEHRLLELGISALYVPTLRVDVFRWSNKCGLDGHSLGSPYVHRRRAGQWSSVRELTHMWPLLSQISNCGCQTCACGLTMNSGRISLLAVWDTQRCSARGRRNLHMRYSVGCSVFIPAAGNGREVRGGHSPSSIQLPTSQPCCIVHTRAAIAYLLWTRRRTAAGEPDPKLPSSHSRHGGSRVCVQ